MSTRKGVVPERRSGFALRKSGLLPVSPSLGKNYFGFGDSTGMGEMKLTGKTGWRRLTPVHSLQAICSIRSASGVLQTQTLDWNVALRSSQVRLTAEI
jgi:hypothetical protein